MKPLLSLLPAIIEGLKESCTTSDGKLKLTPAGLALVLVLTGGAYGYLELRLIRAELAEVKQTTANVWGALVQRGIAQAIPSPTPAPKSGGLISGAEASYR